MTPDDKEDPKLVAYRLELLEKKVDQLHTKFDAFRESVQINRCPNPGACVRLEGIVARLEQLQASHEHRITNVETLASESRSFVRGAVWVAGLLGATLGVLGPALVAGIRAVLFSRG